MEKKYVVNNRTNDTNAGFRRLLIDFSYLNDSLNRKNYAIESLRLGHYPLVFCVHFSGWDLGISPAGKSTQDFFLSGRNMPWWLLGISMVATTFSADTPNLVTDIVRTNGVAGNWVWWAFCLQEC